jgi:hypothetical protein
MPPTDCHNITEILLKVASNRLNTIVVGFFSKSRLD